MLEIINQKIKIDLKINENHMIKINNCCLSNSMIYIKYFKSLIISMKFNQKILIIIY